MADLRTRETLVPMSITIHRLCPVLAAVVVGALGLGACGSSGPVAKSGAKAGTTQTLTIAIPDGDDALARSLIAAVGRRSGGSLRLKQRPGYSSIDPANELKLARDLEAGKVDVGYLPARAWAAAGVPGFRALLAPFRITTDAAAQAVATSPLAQDLLGALPTSLVGLALVPNETRRLLSALPAVEPGDWQGLRVRVVDNPQTAADVEALGAEAVQGLFSREVATQLRHKQLDAAETAPSSALGNGYQNYLRHLSGYGLFPKFQSIVVSRRGWERLSDEQHKVLEAAAQETVAAAPAALAEQEGSNLRQLCAAGVRVTVPTRTQLSALAAAAQPAIDDLNTDEAAARVLAQLDALPGAGPQPLVAPLPDGCSRSGGTTFVHRGPADIPDGTYEVKVTLEEFQSVGADAPPFDRSDVTFWTTIRNGRFINTQKPTAPDQCATKPTKAHPACVGTVDFDGDTVTFTWEPPTPPPVPAPETVKWSYFDGELHFRPVDVADSVSRLIYSHPWHKIG
jgi:TRAP-type C4-dicarboxylate transport system substrate-binding protein